MDSLAVAARQPGRDVADRLSALPDAPVLPERRRRSGSAPRGLVALRHCTAPADAIAPRTGSAAA